MSDSRVKLARKQMTEEVRQYCVDRSLFTEGNVSQYNSMLSLLVSGASLHDVALIIWICSNKNTLTVNEVESFLENSEQKFLKNIS